MNIINVFFISIALSMDAMSVSICEGIINKSKNLSNVFKVAFTFGIFQFFMNYLGFLSAEIFSDKFFKYSKFITFFIFLILAVCMLKEGLTRGKEVSKCDIGFKFLISAGFATSIDSFLVGITFLTFTKEKVLLFSSLIGIITFIISGLSYLLATKFKYNFIKNPNFLAAFILLIIAIKSLF